MEIVGDETAYGRSKLLPIVGHSATLGNVWKLDPLTAKSPLRGLLPYNKVSKHKFRTFFLINVMINVVFIKQSFLLFLLFSAYISKCFFFLLNVCYGIY